MRQRILPPAVGCVLKPINPPAVRIRPDPAWLREHERLCAEYAGERCSFAEQLMRNVIDAALQEAGDGSLRTFPGEVGRWVGMRFYGIGSLSTIRIPFS